MCGEHLKSATRQAARRGSSPRVRGTLPLKSVAFARLGIIPACAGNTRTRSCSDGLTRDHPRVCGEHRCSPAWRASPRGSSPRVRGTPGLLHRLCRSFGIIPACAGNTRWITARPRSKRDHPRVCGEHSLSPMVPLSLTGSSPRVRGTPRLPTCAACRCGIIPACAGNTRMNGGARLGLGDHPRVCGEHLLGRLTRGRNSGSSPRVRGTLGGGHEVHDRGGIIPACAGNTGGRKAAHHGARDHPRVCGEHSFSAS